VEKIVAVVETTRRKDPIQDYEEELEYRDELMDDFEFESPV